MSNKDLMLIIANIWLVASIEDKSLISAGSAMMGCLLVYAMYVENKSKDEHLNLQH
jgi:hypothetical protein